MNKNSLINKIIIRQLKINALEYDCFFDSEANGEMVACRNFDPDIFNERCIFSECSDAELVLLFNAVIDNLPLGWDISCEICKMLLTKGALVKDQVEKIIFDSEFDFSNRQLLYAYLGSGMQYENKIIELLDVIPEDFRDGLFMACYRLNTLAICRKLINKFTEWIKNDPDFGNGTGEEAYLDAFIALWQHTQTPELCDDFIRWRQKWQSL